MKTRDEIIANANEIKEFIDKTTHSVSEYQAIILKNTGIIFDKTHPMYNFYEAPASTKFHGSFQGGLALHSLTVYYSALKLAPSFEIKLEDIDANACIFHDLVKVNSYIPLKIGSGYTYNKDIITIPHGSESLRRMHRYNIPLSTEAWEIAVAYHMGAFESDNMSRYGDACEKYKEVLLLHTADMMATKIYKH